MSNARSAFVPAFRVHRSEDTSRATPEELRPDASDRGFAIGLYLEHLEEASFLYEQRLALLDDPEVPWPRLADFEERLEAHLDALVLGGELALAVCRQQGATGEAGLYHAALTVVCRQRRLDLMRAALDPLDPADDERIRAASDALSREMPPEWHNVIRDMACVGHAGLRRIAARVIGFQRLGASEELLTAVHTGGQAALPDVAWALGRVGEVTARRALSRVFEDAENGAIKAAAGLALLRIGDRGILHACLQQARHQPALLSLVGLAGGWDDLRALLEYDARGEAGPECLLAMGILGEISTMRPLLAALENAATAEAAAIALNLITGAELYDQVVVPEIVEEDELFDDERNGVNDERRTGSTVSRLTRDPVKWRTWWTENAPRFQSLVQYRGGRPCSPLRVLETLTAERNPRWIRELAYQELVIRYRAEIPFESDMLVARQERALADLAQWAASAEALYRSGAWYFSERSRGAVQIK